MKTMLYSCTALQLMMFAAFSPSYGMENDNIIEVTDSTQKTIRVKADKFLSNDIKESLINELNVSMEDLEVRFISVVAKKTLCLSKETMDETRLNFMTSLAENNDKQAGELIRFVAHSPIALEEQKAEAQTWNLIYTQKFEQASQLKQLEDQMLIQNQLIETQHTSDLIVENLLSKNFGNALELTGSLINSPKKEKAELWRSQIMEEMDSLKYPVRERSFVSNNNTDSYDANEEGEHDDDYRGIKKSGEDQ